MQSTETRTITCTYIDTCYPDYLTDHHQRENEKLIMAFIWEGMSTDDLVCEMWNDLNYSACDVFKYFSEAEIKEAMRSEVDSLVSRQFGLRLYDINPEEIYLYAYLSW